MRRRRTTASSSSVTPTAQPSTSTRFSPPAASRCNRATADPPPNDSRRVFPMDRLSALDASFLYLESPTTPMHISSLAIYEGPTPATKELRDMLESRLHLVPRFRQRVMTVPFNQHRPVWVDDVNFDLDAHLHHISLPAPGNERQLKDVVERLLSKHIDRSRPLWEMWLIDDVFGQRFALLSKVHHSLWDGVTGADLHAVLLDASAEPSDVTPVTWT